MSVEEIEERWQGAEISTLPDVPRLVGSGHSAGGVIGSTVGPSADTGLAQVGKIEYEQFLTVYKPLGSQTVKNKKG